jgi:thiamine biosynthesis protein ThiS
MPIRIQLNGEPRELPAPLDVPALLASLGLDPRSVAVERNRLVVKRTNYPETTVCDGDEIEIVAFVGGG